MAKVGFAVSFLRAFLTQHTEPLDKLPVCLRAVFQLSSLSLLTSVLVQPIRLRKHDYHKGALFKAS
jgi:hypothetical protein